MPVVPGKLTGPTRPMELAPASERRKECGWAQPNGVEVIILSGTRSAHRAILGGMYSWTVQRADLSA